MSEGLFLLALFLWLITFAPVGMRNKYQDVYDFLQDEFFVEWIKRPSLESDQFWHAWLKRYPEKKAIVLEAKRVLQSLRYPEAETDESEANEILENILFGISAKAAVEETPAGRAHIIKIWLGSAAVLLVGLFLGMFAYLWQSNIFYSDQELAAVKPPVIIKENPAGVKSTIKLTDGTVVNLNAGSRLTIPQSFGKDYRKVWLEGEAFFEVAEDTERPFIVVTGSLSTTALGTSFNINAFQKNELVLVDLLTGKVNVDNTVVSEGDTLVFSMKLMPGERASLHRKSKQVHKSGFDIDQVTAWREGIILFKDADFEEIIETLSIWYGVQFKVLKKPRYTHGYSGMFDNANLENVLHTIGYASGFQFKIEDKTVTIY